MALQIANSNVVAKIDRLARETGLSKTAVVERAVDLLRREISRAPDHAARVTALLDQLDRVPDRAQPFDPLEWDAQGLPR